MNTLFNTGRMAHISQTAAALSLAVVVTLALLGSLNGLATEQHAATELSKTAALQPAQASSTAAAGRS